MGKRQVLAALHALLICTVRPVPSRDGSPGFVVSRAHCHLLLPLLFVTIMAGVHPWFIARLNPKDTVDWFTILGRVIATLLIVALLVIDSFWKRYQLLALLRALPTAMASGASGAPNLGRVRRLHLCTLALCDCASVLEGSVRLYRNRSYLYLSGIISGLMIEHYILLNGMLCQLMAECVAEEYAGTVCRLLGTGSRATIAHRLYALEHCKGQLKEVLGRKLLLVLLHLLLNISFCTYDFVQKLLYGGLASDVTRLAIIATLDTVTLFVLCYYFDLLHGKVMVAAQAAWVGSQLFKNGARYKWRLFALLLVDVDSIDS
uniref:Uncharacterized protein n=1 Tax=Anopheles albimanus TaxID=7167 RepID=A0A182FEJ2_ANOAL